MGSGGGQWCEWQLTERGPEGWPDGHRPPLTDPGEASGIYQVTQEATACPEHEQRGASIPP